MPLYMGYINTYGMYQLIGLSGSSIGQAETAATDPMRPLSGSEEMSAR